MNTVQELNDLLGRELGTNIFGEPNFKWQFSEELFWPYCHDGTYTSTESPAGLLVQTRNYVRRRMSDKLFRQWVVTAWYPAESLNDWTSNFPGADYPSRGYWIHTNASLNRDESPDLSATELFIARIKEQRSMTFNERLNDMLAEDERSLKARAATVADAIVDDFTAGLNPEPGKRGNFISWQTGVGDSPLLKKSKEN